MVPVQSPVLLGVDVLMLSKPSDSVELLSDLLLIFMLGILLASILFITSPQEFLFLRVLLFFFICYMDIFPKPVPMKF